MRSQAAREFHAEADHDERHAEAARYALLRRLAPALRHNMAGALQPIAMVAAMLERRLHKPDADFQLVAKNASDIITLSKEASSSCLDLMSWLAPKEEQNVQVGQGVGECLGLLATEFSFRGYSVTNQTKAVSAELSRSAVRNVFSAAIIALTDAAATEGNLLIKAEVTGTSTTISIQLQAESSAHGSAAPQAAYRILEWQDVEALAAEACVGINHTPTQVSLHYPPAKIPDL